MEDLSNSISVSQFKAKCLALIEEVARTGLSLVVTKRGKPIARLVPIEGQHPPTLLGSVRYDHEDDVLAPVDESWDADE